ncbi:SPOR domain-containing protein [Ferribacterium limneticum]|uniref:SPOR domain-containing protein n=1 Tax=Ferribacterium limneticum TaxID=76259 RepID=UPI0021F55555|nr:SPOR domain-containing protein [Ferribacterium limneticum]UCV27524.1 SPOR domain-containing protein [Ferribacterium limneticum]UCV31441.1 SPOR domain-containing protein [Ferribacterium limneticum]
MDDNDAQLHLKKRARRRLVGAVFFVSVVAVVLPMVMDHEPRQTVQDVEIRIPGQEEKPFAPKFAAAPVEKPAARPAELPAEKAPAVVAPEVKPTARVLEVVKADDKPAEKPVEKPALKTEKAPEKPAAKPAEKPAEKAAEKPKADDAKRAAAILAGQTAEAKPAAKGGEYLVLIGAFSNEANVKTLKAKLTEQGIKTFSEPLDTPQGKKTRVRAGPFASREAADKALEKMQRIGVSGVVAAKP